MNTKRLLSSLAIAAGALIAPAAASAQPLNSVSLTPGSSGGYLVLDIEGSSTSVGAKVIQMVGNVSSSSQRWNFMTRADGKQQIVNQKSGMCLTTNGVAGAPLYQGVCSGGPRQEWTGDVH